METTKLNGAELEYEVKGSGEPVLLIGTGPIADSVLPLWSDGTLAGRYRLIRYHQRGQVGSTGSPAPVSFAAHAADAAALLGHLGCGRAHIFGHSTGGDIALQLALDHPDRVHSLVLLEPALMGVPSAAAFFEKAEPAFAAYRAGQGEDAMAAFLSAVSGLSWKPCRTVIDKNVPGAVAQAMKDADTFFGSFLPALGDWQFSFDDAARISQPVLSVLGTKTERLFIEGRELLHTWLPQVEDLTVEGVGHLLHIERPQPVARGVTAFLGRHPMTPAEGGAHTRASVPA